MANAVQYCTGSLKSVSSSTLSKIFLMNEEITPIDGKIVLESEFPFKGSCAMCVVYVKKYNADLDKYCYKPFCSINGMLNQKISYNSDENTNVSLVVDSQKFKCEIESNLFTDNTLADYMSVVPEGLFQVMLVG